MAIRGVPREREAISSAPLRVDVHAEQRRRARHDARKLRLGIQLQPELHAEAVAQGAGQLTCARGRADKREARQVEPDGIGRGAFSDNNVDGVILHRRIQNFFHGAVEAVDLVDEQDIPRREVRQQRRKVARLFNGRAGGDADVDAHLIGDDAREGRLAEARRAVEQHMVKRLIAPSGRLDID